MKKNPKKHAGTAPRCFILSNCSAHFQTVRKGWAGDEPRAGLEQDRETHSPSARFRLQFQILQPAAMWELGSSCRVCSSAILEHTLIEGPPGVKSSPAPYKKTLLHPRLRWGRNLSRVLAAWRGTVGKEQLLVQPGGAEFSALLR